MGKNALKALVTISTYYIFLLSVYECPFLHVCPDIMSFYLFITFKTNSEVEPLDQCMYGPHSLWAEVLWGPLMIVILFGLIEFIHITTCKEKKKTAWFKKYLQTNTKNFQFFAIIKGVIQYSSYSFLTFISTHSVTFSNSPVLLLSTRDNSINILVLYQSIQAKWSWKSQITRTCLQFGLRKFLLLHNIWWIVKSWLPVLLQ